MDIRPATVRLAGVFLVATLGASCTSDDASTVDTRPATPVMPATTSESSVETSLPPLVDPPSPSTEAPMINPGGVDGPLVFGRGPFTEGESALLVGTLRLVDDCFVVEELTGDGSTTQPTLVVWRFGTTWDESTMTVVTPSGDRLAVGDEVELGGGYHPLGAADRDVGNIDGVNRLRDCSAQLGARRMFVE